MRASARAALGGLALLAAGCGTTASVHADAAPGDRAAVGTTAPAVTTPPAGRRAPRGVVLLVRTPRHLEAALATADTMREADARGGAPRPFHVIACGDAVEAVLRGAAGEPRVREAVASGVVIAACGMTLEEKGIDAARLDPAVTLVPNGLVEAIRLQETGYVSIEL